MGRCIHLFACTIPFITLATCATCGDLERTPDIPARDGLFPDRVARQRQRHPFEGRVLPDRTVARHSLQRLGKKVSQGGAPRKRKTVLTWIKATGHLLAGLVCAGLGAWHGYNELQWLQGGQQPGAAPGSGYISAAVQVGLPLTFGFYQLWKSATTVTGCSGGGEVRRNADKGRCESGRATPGGRSEGKTARSVGRGHSKPSKG